MLFEGGWYKGEKSVPFDLRRVPPQSTRIALYDLVGGVYVEWKIWHDGCIWVKAAAVGTAHHITSNASPARSKTSAIADLYACELIDETRQK